MQHEPRHTEHHSKDVKRKSIFSKIIIPICIVLLPLIIVYIYNEYSNNKNQNNSQENKPTMQKEKTLIPRQVLFGNPEKINVRISPDGKNISYIAPHNGVLNVFLAKDGDIGNAHPITNDTHRGIRSYFWSHDNKHVIYMQDNNGDENDHLFSVDIDSQEVVELTPTKGVKAVDVTLSKNFPDYALVMLNERRKDLFDLHLLDIKSKKLYMVYKNDKYIGLDIDEDFQMRFAMMSTPEGGTKTDIFEEQDKENGIPALIAAIEAQKVETANTIKHREQIEEITSKLQNTGTSEFLLVGPNDVYTTGISGFTKDKDVVIMSDSRGRDKAGLFELNVKTNEKKLVFESDKADVSSMIQHPVTKEIQAAGYNYARNKLHFFDGNIESIFAKAIAESKVDGEASIVSRSVDGKSLIVAVASDTSPAQYYKVDANSSNVKYLFSGDSQMSSYTLNPMNPLVIKARDGLEMISYLTLPKDANVRAEIDDETDIVRAIKTEKTFPLVLYVHGGPTARDEWGLSRTHQWLSDRGYAVLSVNYRGSTGFGKDFINAGNGEWSRKMHDDLIDAAKWAVDNKITTQDNIGIMGGSYGGYAALVGLTFTPDFFKCGVDIVGPSNLLTLMNSIPEYWKPLLENLKRKIGGDPATEEGRKELELRSPLTYVEKISKPLLIAQGANDPRVKKAESDQIASTMKEKDIPVIYALYNDEGHGFARPENRMSFFVLTEYFLHQHMGGEVEAATANDFKGSSLELVEGEKLLPDDISKVIHHSE